MIHPIISQYQRYVLFIMACILPLTVVGSSTSDPSEEEIKVAMRMIGHQFLNSVGDKESRILPIEKIGDRYKIPFEVEFGFEPDSIISIVDRVSTQINITNGCLVSIERCETEEDVYSFISKPSSDVGFATCSGRTQPKDCYTLFVTILEDNSSSQDNSILTSPLGRDSNPMKSALLMVPLLLVMGFVGYISRKKDAMDADPHLITLGAMSFDQRNMILSYQDQRTELSAKEADLLALLYSSANTAIEREVILQKVWGDEGAYVGRTLDVTISKLRKKLEADSTLKIINIRSVGYKLVVDKPWY